MAGVFSDHLIYSLQRHLNQSCIINRKAGARYCPARRHRLPLDFKGGEGLGLDFQQPGIIGGDNHLRPA